VRTVYLIQTNSALTVSDSIQWVSVVAFASILWYGGDLTAFISGITPETWYGI